MQKRGANNKSTSEKYSPLEDSGAGFPIEPLSGEHVYPCVGSAMHPGAYGNSRSNNMRDGDLRAAAGRSVSNLKSNGPQLRTQRSYMPQYGDAGDSSVFSEMASRNTTNLRYNRLDVVEPSEKQHGLGRPASTHKKDKGGKDSTMVKF